MLFRSPRLWPSSGTDERVVARHDLTTEALSRDRYDLALSPRPARSFVGDGYGAGRLDWPPRRSPHQRPAFGAEAARECRPAYRTVGATIEWVARELHHFQRDGELSVFVANYPVFGGIFGDHAGKTGTLESHIRPIFQWYRGK